MKLKELESWLSQCDQFDKPKVVLEQYATSAHVAARMIYSAQENLTDAAVCDLGSGCGILSIGSILAGAAYVCGFEVDEDAIEIAIGNCDEMFDDSENPVNFVNTEIDIRSDALSPALERFSSCFDVIIMNPPFGTKNNAGADYKFLKQAIHLVRPEGHIYSLHKSSTREFFKKKMALPIEKLGVTGNVLAQIRYDLPKCYKFHKEKSVDIAVDFWHFQKQSKP
ncbi:unnamed protein product [Allacma fusca]|uniref:Methyltransferase small domain-containing protein n=1 Tax=Allacma fusca TaxID=39272 RepID=A0A8J2L3Z4_9HEXA|nr:unnamed protein product [Allacma fusca]